MKINLSNGEKKMLKYISVFKVFGVLVTMMGLTFILLVVYGMLFSALGPDAKQLSLSLLLFSIGFVFLGYLLWMACTVADKLNKNSVENKK